MAPALSPSVFALLSIGAGFILLTIAWRGWPFQRYPGAKTWTAVLIVVAIWDISYGLALMVFDPAIRPWFDIPVLFGRALSIPYILKFALEYTGRERLARSKWMLALFGFYAFSFGLAVTNPLHHLMWTDYQLSPVFGAAAVDFTPKLYYVLAGISYLTIALAIALLADMIGRYRSVFGKQALSLIGALLVPSVANLIWMFRLGPTQHLDLTPVGHIAIASLLTYALFSEGMFEVVPATRYKAKQEAFDDLATAVITVTKDGLIIDVNARALQQFDTDREAVILQPITEFVDISIPPSNSVIELSNPFGRQQEYNAAISEIDTDDGKVIGYSITLQDITTERLRQQRLKVLNRVLRHNLRNDLNVVSGYAEILELETSNPSNYADRIQAISADLVDISNKARSVEKVLSRQEEPIRIGLGEAILQTVNELKPSLEDCDIRTTVPANQVDINGPVFSAVLRELVENACLHNDSSSPVVDVEAVVEENSDYPIQVTVTDNGPGIPDHELYPLDAGTETDLEHGSGLGLWLVKWGVKSLNGHIEFEDQDPNGTAVTMYLRALD